ncbi:DUF6362 family protein [Magnetofaba australis]|uniref:DUF6362 family protein n=1 Tax=Magnetofaba australis TaxID=1472297 RepID=UPI000A19D16C|nr:DUF6362 family protein [Magnetofaba australis]
MADQQFWSAQMVVDRLEEAASTLQRLPKEGPRDLKASWPQVIHDFWNAYGWDKARTRLGPPTPDAIDRMDECMEWLRWLEPEQMRLVWARAERLQWKRIMAQLGVCRETARQRYLLAVATIAARLNQKVA